MSFFLRHKRYDTQIADAFYIDIVSFTSRSLIHFGITNQCRVQQCFPYDNREPASDCRLGVFPLLGGWRSP